MQNINNGVVTLLKGMGYNKKLVDPNFPEQCLANLSEKYGLDFTSATPVEDTCAEIERLLLCKKIDRFDRSQLSRIVQHHKLELKRQNIQKEIARRREQTPVTRAAQPKQEKSNMLEQMLSHFSENELSTGASPRLFSSKKSGGTARDNYKKKNITVKSPSM